MVKLSICWPRAFLFILSIFFSLAYIGYGDTTQKPFDLDSTINDFKEKAKEIGIERPEDIPQVSDWMDQCKKKVGKKVWRVIRTSPNKMMDCVSKHINYEKIKLEMEDSKERGELDLVFKKYCSRRVELMGCVDEILERVQPCLNDQQQKDLNITRKAVDAGIDFTCHENGDRIALFISEEGIECVQNNTDPIRKCIESKVPEVKKIEDAPTSLSIDQFLINDENCKKLQESHDCIVDATSTCDDPTPSNILESLIKQVLKVTPCRDFPPRAYSSSSSFYRHFWGLWPHFLTIILSGLTAAQILL